MLFNKYLSKQYIKEWLASISGVCDNSGRKKLGSTRIVPRIFRMRKDFRQQTLRQSFRESVPLLCAFDQKFAGEGNSFFQRTSIAHSETERLRNIYEDRKDDCK